jgi:CD63 antigen
VKYVLFIFNILFVVSGILLIVFGSIVLADMDDYSNIDQAWELHSGPIVIIVLGCIIFLISFMGCCGAIRESLCCTLMYSIVMLLLFFCQIALIVYVWTQRPQILNAVDQAVEKIWDQHKENQPIMDTLQLSFKCCGKSSYTDYVLAFENIPNSCCGASATSCSFADVTKTVGCADAVKRWWNTNLDIIRYAGLAVAAIEMVAFIFGFCLYNGIRNSDRRMRY